MLLLLSYSFLGLFFVPLVFFYFIFVCRDSASFLHLHVTVLRLFFMFIKSFILEYMAVVLHFLWSCCVFGIDCVSFWQLFSISLG